MRDDVPIAEYTSIASAQEHELVVLAMNLECRLEPGDIDGHFRLHVEQAQEPRIAAEIAEYDAEQREMQRQPTALELPRFSAGPWLALGWSALLMSVLVLQSRFPGITSWGSSSSSGLLERGEWWRPFTALFLHADSVHLIFNIVSGAAFAMMAAAALGRYLAWSLILIAGVAGNLLTIMVRYPGAHNSIGASTSVFGALGLLAGYGFYLAFRYPASSPWRSVLVPIGGALALLGLQGAGGDNTDVLAHLFGFLCGTLLGVIAGWWRLQLAIQASRRQSPG